MTALLCVDVLDAGTGTRRGTEGLVRERRAHRDEFRALCPVTILTGPGARPEAVADALRQAQQPVTVVAYLGHGRPGVLYYRMGEGLALLSAAFPLDELEAAAAGRALYFFSCRTLTAGFAAMLLQCGASRVAGFSMSPAYSDLNGRKRLGNFDAYVIRSLCLHRPAGEILRFRDQRVAMARADQARHGSARFKRSMDEFMCALKSFHLYPEEEECHGES